MRGSRRAGRAAAALAATSLVLAPGAVAKGPKTEQVSTSGALTYTWQGDPALGCAAHGVCEIAGALSEQLSGGGDVIWFGRQGMVDLNPSTTIRVRRGGAAAPAGVCVENSSFGGFGGFQLQRVQGRVLATPEGSVSSGDCAGPLAGELANVALPVRRSAGVKPTYDLRGTVPFTAGPFRGELISTLVLHPASPAGLGGSSFSFSSGSSPGRTPAHRVLLERVSVVYRLAPLPGELSVDFTGDPGPFCAALDNCGGGGTLTIAPASAGHTLELLAQRVVRKRRGAHQALADFRAGRLPIIFPGFTNLTAIVGESFSWSGGASCTDSVTASGLQLIVGAQAPRTPPGPVAAALSEQGSNSMRTHCPGPGDTEIFGSNDNSDLLHGSLPRSTLLRRELTVSLSDPGHFSNPGYRGVRIGSFGVSLAQVRVRAGTVSEAR